MTNTMTDSTPTSTPTVSSRVTWNEFKKAVDRKLAELGNDGSCEISYIDISYPHTDDLDIIIEYGDLKIL